jgi:hypothetical protein
MTVRMKPQKRLTALNAYGRSAFPSQLGSFPVTHGGHCRCCSFQVIGAVSSASVLAPSTAAPACPRARRTARCDACAFPDKARHALMQSGVARPSPESR